jgi:hypothetical protein
MFLGATSAATVVISRQDIIPVAIVLPAGVLSATVAARAEAGTE